MLAIAILLLVALSQTTSAQNTGPQVYFLPSYGSNIDTNGTRFWQIRVYGIAFEYDQEKDNTPADFIDALGRLRDDATLTQQQRDNIENRTALFRADLRSDQIVEVHFPGGQNFTTTKDTDLGGTFNEFALNVTVPEGAKSINWTSPNAINNGYATLPSHEGISFVLDFDDILRITKIWNLDEAIRISFAEEYQTVPGIKEVLTKWEDEITNPMFHYLTTTPIQMAPIYEKWIFANFPKGSLGMRPVGIDDPLAVLNARKDELEEYVRILPNRKYVIVGDVSTLDQLQSFPDWAVAHPNNLLCIFLRNISAEHSDYNSLVSNDQIADFMKDVSPTNWFIYDHTIELADIDIANNMCHPPGYGPNDVSSTKGAVTPKNLVSTPTTPTPTTSTPTNPTPTNQMNNSSSTIVASVWLILLCIYFTFQL